MQKYTFCDITESPQTLQQAKQLMLDTYPKVGMWETLDEKEAAETMEESTADGNICLGIKLADQLIGWVGLRPAYKFTWELHPLVLAIEHHGKGYGTILMTELEKLAKSKGITGIYVGSDDETAKTSLSQVDITSQNIFHEMATIKNYDKHPYEFYQKCGYFIVGIVPNANGKHKPDIMLWKDIS
ncbi:MAG: GNAT family N-acetyltransferase [Firmicutes bacterium]|nr:GNAT family N-acetyltransferase [Bacillota bacterium]